MKRIPPLKNPVTYLEFLPNRTRMIQLRNNGAIEQKDIGYHTVLKAKLIEEKVELIVNCINEIFERIRLLEEEYEKLQYSVIFKKPKKDS